MERVLVDKVSFETILIAEELSKGEIMKAKKYLILVILVVGIFAGGCEHTKSKPEVGIEEFCRDFYDRYIFHAIVAGDDLWSGSCEVFFNSAVEGDQSFSSVDTDLFQHEMTALRMEVVGLAWTHHLKRDEYLLREIAFTKNYLKENGHPDIWDAMLAYNQAIARSSVEIVGTERMRRAHITFMNKFRMELFSKWMEAGVDPECAARVGNRMVTDVAWDKQITLKHLTATLADRLACDINLNSEALFRLSAIIFGFYEGAKEAIEPVNTQE